MRREDLQKAKRLVVKVGTSTITYATGQLNYHRIEKLVRELADLANQGKEIILVTSGAIGVGMNRMGLKERPKTIPEKQAAAAVGQGALMHIYEKFFSEYGKITAQILLTKEDSIKHSRFTHSRNALLTLLKMGVIPVINENDAVAVDEIKIGDNDTLSAIVATIVDADVLILLSDIEGLYDANPQTNPDAKKIAVVDEITAEIEDLAGGPGSKNGTGGMQTKIQAAKIAVRSGIHMLIGSGARENILHALLHDDSVGTLFVARASHMQFRKRWLAFGARLAGTITVDEGCVNALNSGASLLAAGVLAVDGVFAEGDVVRILNRNGRELARGRTNYDSTAIGKIRGVHTDEIITILGTKPYDEIIHRDNLVLLTK